MKYAFAILCFAVAGCSFSASQDPTTGKPVIGVGGTLTLHDAKQIVAFVKAQKAK